MGHDSFQLEFQEREKGRRNPCDLQGGAMSQRVFVVSVRASNIDDIIDGDLDDGCYSNDGLDLEKTNIDNEHG